MIQDLKISYVQDSNINVTINIYNKDEIYITPYNIADLITKLINDGNINPNAVISQLIDEFNYKNE